MGKECSNQGLLPLNVPPQRLKRVVMSRLYYALQRHIEPIRCSFLFARHYFNTLLSAVLTVTACCITKLKGFEIFLPICA